MTIVVGYLATPEGAAALEAAAREAALRSAKLVVVVSDKGRLDADARLGRDAELDQVRATLEAKGLAHEVRQINRGRDVADDLVDTAEEFGASMIVIGLRRRSPVGKLILGSNAQRILLDAPCPVLAVKPATS